MAGVGLAVQIHIVLELRTPREMAIILLAQDGLPNSELPHLPRLPVCSPIGASRSS